MESADQYNFNIFRPRNNHGRKNRNIIFSLLFIWAVAVFGFQFLLRGIEKPTPEDSLLMFESTWPQALKGTLSSEDLPVFLRSLVHVRGKNTVKTEDQVVISEAVTTVLLDVIPDTLRNDILLLIAGKEQLKSELADMKDEDYLDRKERMTAIESELKRSVEPYSGFNPESLEANLLISCLKKEYQGSITDDTFSRLSEIMKFYLIHNRSLLTDTTFLGFPFHYFYTAVFLLIMFVVMCIIYNVLIEWRLRQGGVTE